MLQTSGAILLCHSDDFRRGVLANVRLAGVDCRGGVVVAHAADAIVDAPEIEGRCSSVVVRRHLDRYWLCLPLDDNRRQLVLDTFCGMIAEDYERLIEVERNQDNIVVLLRALRNQFGVTIGETVVDWGCGTGLSLPLAREVGLNVIGVDRSPEMRRIAAARGMTVYSIDELSGWTDGSVPAAFASYVFHLLCEFEGLGILWRKLHQGGVLVGNFHKDGELDSVVEFLSEAGAAVLSLDVPHAPLRHGRYLGFAKVG